MPDDQDETLELALQLTETFTIWTQQQRTTVTQTEITNGLAEFIAGAFVAIVQGRPLAEQEAILSQWFTQVRSMILQREA